MRRVPIGWASAPRCASRRPVAVSRCEHRELAPWLDRRLHTGSCQPLDAGRGQGVVAMTGLLIHASFGGLAARGGPLRNRSGQTL